MQMYAYFNNKCISEGDTGGSPDSDENNNLTRAKQGQQRGVMIISIFMHTTV